MALVESYNEALGQTVVNFDNKKLVATILPLKNTSIHWRAFSDAIAVNQEAEAITVDFSNAEHESLMYFASALSENKCLKNLCFFTVKLSDEVGQAFVDAIYAHEKLESFGLFSEVSVFNQEINDRISNKLARNRFNNAIDHDNATLEFRTLNIEDEKIVAEIMAEDKYLKDLLIPTGLREEPLIALFESLSKNQTLENLTILHCGLTNKVSTAIAEMLKKNRSLKHLAIDGLFSSIGFKTMVSGLKGNYALTKISTHSPQLYDLPEYKDAKISLTEILKRNRIISPILDKAGHNFVNCLLNDLTINDVTLLPELKIMMIQNFLYGLLKDNLELQTKKPE